MYSYKKKITQCLQINNYANLYKFHYIKLIQIRHRHRLFNINLT